MAKGKASFIVYSDSKSLVDKLPDETAGKLFKMLFAYVNDESPKTKDIVLDIAFEHFRQKLKNDLKKWDEIKVKRSESGRKGGLAKQANARSAKKIVANLAVNDTVTVNDTVNDILLEKETKEVFKSWLEYRKEIKRPIKSEKTMISLAKKIKENGAKRSKEVMQRSIDNQWQGLFWDKKNNPPANQNNEGEFLSVDYGE